MPQKSEVYRRRNRVLYRSVIAEALECRQMLSSVTDPQAQPTEIAPLIAAGSSSPPGFSPTQIEQAYGINNVSFGGTAGNGAGQTIAIVVAWDNPKFVDSTDANFDSSDLHQFDLTMGIADPPSFIKVNQTGGTTYPPQDPSPTPTTDWENETALDVEWTHALAPAANIELVEASSTSLSDLVGNAAHYAATVPGVSVVTMSFAVNEFSFESNYDAYLESPQGHQGVTFIAASGDVGGEAQYPATSPNVTAVGSTTLTLSNGNYSSESGTTSGGGISQYETKPSFQYNEDQSSTWRTVPDVAFDGNPNTGVSVYDSFNGGSDPWYKVGGTSFAAPAWASLIAIANQGRAHIGLGTLDGPNQTDNRLYSLNGADYHDITTGSNGYSAGAGYDLVTGLGTPIANKLIPDLAGGNEVSGTFFNDLNGNGQQDSGEAGLSGDVAFIDLAQTGTLNGVDFSATSDSNGDYQFNDVPGGTYRFTQTTPNGATLTAPSHYYTLTLGYDTTFSGEDFGYEASGAATKLAFVQQPTTVAAGAVITPAITVEVENALGDIVTGNSSAVTLSIGSGSGALGGTLTENAVDGIATFSNITIASAGLESIVASDGVLTSATTGSITVTAANSTPLVPAKLAFAQGPTGTTAGNIITPAVTVIVEDADGNQVTTNNSAVTLSIGAGAATLGGTVTVDAVNGVATFANLVVSAAESTAFTATDGTLTSATSSPVTFTPAPVVPIIPAQVVFTQQPVSSQIGSVISPAITVEVRDSNGRLVVADTSAVTLSIVGSSATLGGTLTMNAVAGVATFSDISVSAAGNYTLKATDGDLNSAVSNTFNIAVPGTIAPTIVRSSLPIKGIAGMKLGASVLVSNLANATTPSGTVTTNIYASDNGVLTLLGTVIKKSAVKAGKAYPISVPIKLLPASLVGTYTLMVRTVDSNGNYLASAPGATITVAAPVVIFSETITKTTLPSAVVAGSASKAVALVKITNTGNVASTGMTTVGLYASADGSVQAGVLIASLMKKLAIHPGASAVVSVPLKLIPATLDGNYTLLAEVTNPTAAASSTNSGLTVDIAPPFVALSSLIGAVGPASLAAGKMVSIAITVKNTGNIDATGSATINVGLSSDGTTELSGSTTSTRTVQIIPNKPYVLHLKFLVPGTITAGMYFPFVSFSVDGNSTQAVGSTALTIT